MTYIKPIERRQNSFQNSVKLNAARGDSEVDGAIQSYELAFRMQRQMLQVIDLSGETAATQKASGFGSDKTDDMSRKCLLARRMIEAGVRFVEITHGNGNTILVSTAYSRKAVTRSINQSLRC